MPPDGFASPDKSADPTPAENLKMIQEKMNQNNINNQQTLTPKRP